MITVLHYNRQGKKDPSGIYFYIGRYNRRYNLIASNLANPYYIGEHGTRTEVVEKYKIWIIDAYKRKGIVTNEINWLIDLHKQNKNIFLLCWCAPQACHGDVLKDMVEKFAQGLPYE